MTTPNRLAESPFTSKATVSGLIALVNVWLTGPTAQVSPAATLAPAVEYRTETAWAVTLARPAALSPSEALEISTRSVLPDARSPRFPCTRERLAALPATRLAATLSATATTSAPTILNPKSPAIVTKFETLASKPFTENALVPFSMPLLNV